MTLIRTQIGRALIFGVLAPIFVTPAQADLTISSKPTRNMNCSAGVCTAMAPNATLNVKSLANMLASGDVTVTTGGGSITIQVNAPLSWASTRRLTLSAYNTVEVEKPISVTGSGAMTIVTDSGGSGGDFVFFGKGHVKFWDPSSSLIINSKSFTLVNSIAMLAEGATANTSGNFALAEDYNAKHDGTYTTSPIANTFETTYYGTFEGLGNTISNLKINGGNDNTANGGLFGNMAGTIHNIGLVQVKITTVGGGGTLAAFMVGRISRSWATGSVTCTAGACVAGGLAGLIQGDGILQSHADVAVSGTHGASEVGGLAGFVYSAISQSYSLGAVSVRGDFDQVGGLAGVNDGVISQSYATGAVSVGNGHGDRSDAGGLAGQSIEQSISESYSTGTVSAASAADLGGLVGYEETTIIGSAYWDTTTSGVAQGCGNIENCAGATGLTTGQFQSGLPSGFDPAVWGQSANKNNGYPYLLDNPPQ